MIFMWEEQPLREQLPAPLSDEDYLPAHGSLSVDVNI